MLKRVFFFLFLMSCSFSNDTVNNNKQKVIVAALPDNPPQLFVETGVLKGHLTEILPALGEVTGLEFEFKEMNISSALTALSQGLIDMVPSLIVTEERKKNVDLSRYYEWGFLIIVYNKGNVFQDLNSLKGRRVAVTIGSADEKIIDESNASMDLDLDIYRYDTKSICLQSLRSGKVDATIMAYDRFVIMNNNDLSSSILDFQFERAFGFRKNRGDDLIKRINEGITTLKDSGKLDKMRSKWYYYKVDK